MTDNTVPGKATCSGRKPIPTLKCKAVEVVKSAVIHKKASDTDPAKKNKASTSKKKKDKALTPPKDSNIEVRNEKPTDTMTGGSSTAHVNLSRPSQQATVEDIEETKELEPDSDKEESSDAELGEFRPSMQENMYISLSLIFRAAEG